MDSRCSPATGNLPLSWSLSPSPPSCRTCRRNCKLSSWYFICVLSHTQELSLACLDVWTLATLFSLNYFASKGGATNTCFYCTKTINAGSLENSLQFSSTVQHSLVYSSFHIFCPKHVKTNRVPWQTGTFSKWDSHRPLLHSLSPHTFLSFCCCDAALVLCSLSPWRVKEIFPLCRCRGWKLR